MNELKKNISILPYNYLKFNAVFAHYFQTSHEEAFINFCSDFQHSEYPILFLGSGSNLILKKNYYKTLCVHNMLTGIQIKQTQKKHYFVEVMSGNNFSNFVDWSLENKMYGLENLTSIPGTVGAAPIQNIGAYGVELSHFVDSIYVLDIQKNTTFWLNQSECDFQYRSSIFKRKPHWFILRVIFKLNKDFELKTEYPGIKEYLKNTSTSSLS